MNPPSQALQVVFLCTGNAARSVMATTIAQAMLDASGRSDIEVWGAGTHSIEGLPMSTRTRSALRMLHLENPDHRSHQFVAEDAARADVIIAFEPGNVAWIRREHPDKAAVCATIGHIAAQVASGLTAAELPALLQAARVDEIPHDAWPELIDPAGGDQAIFDACIREVDALVRSIFSALAPEVPAAAASASVLLMPVKAFEQAKFRLSPDVDPNRRQELAQEMATHVASVASPMPVAVVCDDEGVASWAESVGASVLWKPGTDLNSAVQLGVASLAEQGYRDVIVAHSDLPLAADFQSLAGWPGVTIVPDRHRAGSNVIAVPADSGFQFAYGPGSFQRHVREAVRIGRGIRIVHQARLAWDVDFPTDLDFPADLGPQAQS